VTVTVRRLGDEGWATLREVRLDALRDAPYAFNSTLDDECTHEEPTWRRRLRDQAWFVAVEGARAVGVAAGGHLGEPDPAVRTLRSMWVDPAHRGGGAAGHLVESVVEWARVDGASTLTLWALPAAARARSFYLGHGFVELPGATDDRPSRHPAMTRYTLAL
jgi:GNAT superfamily N-acetyltransferase